MSAHPVPGPTPASPPAGLDALNERLDGISQQLGFLIEQQRAQAELIEEARPILRAMMDVGIERFAELETRGWFAFGRGSLKVLDRLVENYGEDDLEQLADALVGILDTVRAATQPALLEVAGEVTDTLGHTDGIAPIGLMGALKASREDDVQHGLAVAMELVRRLGRSSRGLKRQRRSVERQRKVSALIGPPKERRFRRNRPAAGAPAVPTSAPAAARPAATPARTSFPHAPDLMLDAQGFLTDHTQWNRELAELMALDMGLALSPRHFEVLAAARGLYADSGASPNIRKLSSGASLEVKELYALFPRAPGKTIARLAGLPRPTGCI